VGAVVWLLSRLGPRADRIAPWPWRQPHHRWAQFRPGAVWS